MVFWIFNFYFSEHVLCDDITTVVRSSDLGQIYLMFQSTKGVETVTLKGGLYSFVTVGARCR